MSELPPGATNRSDAPEVVDVRPGEEQDWDRVEAYLRQHLPELAQGPFEVRQFPKGFANLTYLVRFGDQRLVLRRPPFGTLAPGAHDMAREHRALSRLWQAYPAAPRSYLHCADHSVLGADFFVMEYRQGVNVWDAVPASMAHHDRAGYRIGEAVVDALAELHQVDPDAVGLGDLGRPGGFVQRQLDGWSKRWSLVRTSDGDDEGRMDLAAAALAASVPMSQRTSLLHNDFKIDNCQFDPDDPDRVHSVFDWDQATQGDPLVDVGILLNYWPLEPGDAGTNAAIAGTEELGLPSRAELVARYAGATGIDPAPIAWYEAFAAWKTAVVRQQLFVRFLRGESTDPRMERLGSTIDDLAGRALHLLGA